MAGSWKVNIITFISVLFAVYTQHSKLNVPRVLLPLFREFCTSFTLEVSDKGCYKWWVVNCCKVMLHGAMFYATSERMISYFNYVTYLPVECIGE